MFDTIGMPELLIILAIIVLVFGVGRVGAVGKELGTAVREFRRGLKEGDESEKTANQESGPSKTN